jgi:hypothetical protein
MSRPGAPGTWNREIHYALTGASWRRVRSWDPVRTFPFRSGAYVVTKATPGLPWGRSLHASGYLTHVVDEILIAWRAGRPVGWKVRWRCGSGTSWFRLLDEPDSTVCPVCLIERPPRERKRP